MLEVENLYWIYTDIVMINKKEKKKNYVIDPRGDRYLRTHFL